jgi:hypothetical protein
MRGIDRTVDAIRAIKNTEQKAIKVAGHSANFDRDDIPYLLASLRAATAALRSSFDPVGVD